MSVRLYGGIFRAIEPLAGAAFGVVLTLSGCATNHDTMVAPAPKRP